jgi:hypothetical protein
MIWLSTLADEFEGKGPSVRFRRRENLNDSVTLREIVTCPGHIHATEAGHLESSDTSKNLMLILSGVMIAVWLIRS